MIFRKFYIGRYMITFTRDTGRSVALQWWLRNESQSRVGVVALRKPTLYILKLLVNR